MFKKKKRSRTLIYILIFIMVLVLILTGKFIRNFFNVVNNKIFSFNDKKIVISDEVLNSYVSSLKLDIVRLNQLLDLNVQNEECINATVLYRNPSHWYNSLIINKGLKSNINKGDMVISTTGLVGVVDEVLDDSASILLITNIDNERKITVALKDGDNLVYGIISDYNKIKNEIVVSEITSDIKNINNIDVITTGFTNTFKEGILIGKLIRIEDSKDGLSKIAYVNPSTDYNNVKYVCVVSNK